MMLSEKNINGNRLIASFMGLKQGSGIGENTVIWRGQYCSPHFHDSWDWIMLVCMKINKTHEYTEMDGDAFLEGEQQIQVMKIAAGNVDIGSTWKAVVKFIEWYNQYSKF